MPYPYNIDMYIVRSIKFSTYIRERSNRKAGFSLLYEYIINRRSHRFTLYCLFASSYVPFKMRQSNETYRAEVSKLVSFIFFHPTGLLYVYIRSFVHKLNNVNHVRKKRRKGEETASSISISHLKRNQLTTLR